MSDEIAPQDLVAGKYRLTRLLGRGGMGSVWEGVHTTLGTRVACKFIESEHAVSKEARNRFENEARAAASLRSKHVVEVYDHGVMDDGRPYIVMEFLRGEPLDARLDRVGQLPVQEVAGILLQVSRALTKAHASGIVHRDLKPDNVFLVWDEEDQADIAKVVDFGIAKFTDESMGVGSQTRTGSVLGTPYYMSPEQARGLRSVDHRSDLWSLGVIAYQALSGVLPFDGEAVGNLLVRICTTDPPPLSAHRAELAALDAWVRRALERDPEARFQSAQEMVEALAALAGVPVRGPRLSVVSGTLDLSASPVGPSSPSTEKGAAAMTNAGVARDAKGSTSARAGRPMAWVGGLVAAAAAAAIAALTISSLGSEVEPPESTVTGTQAATAEAEQRALREQAAQEKAKLEQELAAARDAIEKVERERTAAEKLASELSSADAKVEEARAAEAQAQAAEAQAQAAEAQRRSRAAAAQRAQAAAKKAAASSAAPASGPRPPAEIDLGY